jgi:hypothetical protein
MGNGVMTGKTTRSWRPPEWYAFRMNENDHKTFRQYLFHFRPNSDHLGNRIWEFTAEQVDQTVVSGPDNLQWRGSPERAGQVAIQLGLASDTVVYLTLPSHNPSEFHLRIDSSPARLAELGFETFQ